MKSTFKSQDLFCFSSYDSYFLRLYTISLFRLIEAAGKFGSFKVGLVNALPVLGLQWKHPNKVYTECSPDFDS